MSSPGVQITRLRAGMAKTVGDAGGSEPTELDGAGLRRACLGLDGDSVRSMTAEGAVGVAVL